MEIISGADKIYYYVKEKNKATFSQLSKKFNIKEEKIEQLAIILDKAQMLKLIYPTNPFLEPYLTTKQNLEKQNQKQAKTLAKQTQAKSNQIKFNFPNPFSTNYHLQKQKKYLKELQEEAAQGILKLKKLDNKINYVKAEHQQLKAQIKKQKLKQDEVFLQIKKLKTKLNPVTKKIKTATLQLEENSSRISKYRTELKTLKGNKKKQVKKWLSSRLKKQKKGESKLKKLISVEKKLAKKISLLERKSQEQKLEKEELTKQLDFSAKEETKITAQISNLKSDLEELNKEMDLILAKASEFKTKLKREVFQVFSIAFILLLVIVFAIYLMRG